MKEKTGIYVPLITPFQENGEVDYDGLAKATKFVLESGADGIYALGGSSEFCMLSVEERKRCLEVIIANAGDAEVIAHVGSTSTKDAIELAKHAEKAGACMLSAVAPYYFGYTFAQVKEYFHQIAHATKLNLMMYSAAQARSYTFKEIKEILNDEKITAVKYTGCDYYMLERLITACPNVEFYTGSDEMFICGQAVGAHGAIGLTYNFNADKLIACKKLFQAGKNAEALALVHKINGMVDGILSVGNLIAATKYMMTLQGLEILSNAREPFTQLSEEDKALLKKAYEENK